MTVESDSMASAIFKKKVKKYNFFLKRTEKNAGEIKAVRYDRDGELGPFARENPHSF